jgi:dephospho-CoA kinase
VSTVIGVCGYSGAGKTTFCREMARRFPLPVLSTGEFVRRRLAGRGEALTPENIARASDEIRLETGQRFVRVLAPDLMRSFSSSPAVLLDCLREESDLSALRELEYRVALVAIAAEDDVRALRSRGRERPGDPISPAGLLALNERERQLGVERLIAVADYVIANDGDLGQFIARAAAVVGDILASV